MPKRINELYSEHAKVLEQAKSTTPEECPTLRASLAHLQQQVQGNETATKLDEESDVANTKRDQDKARII